MNQIDNRDEYERLCRMISRWNDRRVELFEISLPNQRLEFEGVMKFYFQYQDIHGQKVATKCIRVSNTATVQDVIEVLVQKFRPDLRMLPNIASYALYEVHSDEEERRMGNQEKPLLTMLKWSSKDIDGRFLLRNEHKMPYSFHSKLIQGKKSPQTKKKKSPKIEKRKNRYIACTPTDIPDSGDIDNEKGQIARSLYSDYPPSRFTRSITNPDIIRTHWNNSGNRRVKDLIHEEDHSAVPISMETLALNMPSKSILATKSDTAVQLVKSAVEKFGLTYDPDDYCLVQVTIPPVLGSTGDINVQEHILDDNESPVKIHNNFASGNDPREIGTVEFHLRRRDSFKKCFKFPSVDLSSVCDPIVPVLVELSDTNHHYSLSLISTEIGSRSLSLNSESHLCLTNHGIRPRHCSITKSKGNCYIITLLDSNALVKVNDNLVTDSMSLHHESIIQLGDSQMYRFLIPVSLHTRSNSALPAGTAFYHMPHDGLSKAFSSDDLGNSLHFKGHGANSHIKYRTVSEHTLKGDEDHAVPVSSVDSVSLQSATKNRHNSIPQESYFDETTLNELAVLPGSITFQQANVTQLLEALLVGLNGYLLQFKLAPSYAIYMIARHHLSSDFIPDPSRHESLVFMLKYACSLIRKTVKDNKNVPGLLAFWLSNTSELLHFLRRDYLLYMFAKEYENTLTNVIHVSYKYFTGFIVREISVFLSVFLSESSDVDSEEPVLSEPNADTSQEPDIVAAVSHNNVYWSRSGAKVNKKGQGTLGDILSTLSSTVSLLHLCKVNSTLSILIFNLIFRYISMRLFNKLITEPQYCTRAIGMKLHARLEKLKCWADKENLKLLADERLTLVFQAAKLLVTSNDDMQDINYFHTLIFQLNSQQVKTLLKNSESANGKGLISPHFAEKLIAMAYEDVDQKLLADGHDVNIQEDSYLELPFLIPEHGYSCDSMRGVPVGLEEYLETAVNNGLCQFVIAKDSLGCWIPPRVTTSKQRESPLSTQTNTQMSQTLPKNFPYNSSHVAEDQSDRPKSSMDIPTGILYGSEDVNIIEVSLKKGSNKSLGISICEARDPSNSVGIFIRSLSRDGLAYQDGRLHPGDQILKINNTFLNGYSRESVKQLLSSIPNQVTITVATNVAQLFQINDVFLASPQLSDKLPDNPSEVGVIPPPKEGSSHAMKAARREMRRQQQGPNRTYDQYQSHTMSPVPTLMSKWLQEQRIINQQKIPQRISVPGTSNSMSSLIPEQEEPSLPNSMIPSDVMSNSSLYRVTTPSGSDISDNSRNIRTPSYGRVSSNFRNDYNNFTVESSSNLSLGNNSQTPYRDVSSLSGQPSDVDSSQSYPSLMREKLSMEVGYHTQLSSTGLSVSSVLDQLSRKGKKGDLQVSELEGFEVDELQLEKQRMQLLFYRQQKEKREQQLSSTPSEQPLTLSSIDNKQTKNEPGIEDDNELIMNPEQMVLFVKVKQEFDSVRKLINDQRKRCRELQFAKEREEQSLAQTENRLKSQNRHFMPFMRPEDEARWQRDQKRKIKEWERHCSEKKEELHQIEVKEIQAKTRLRAFEQHASELKKQLHLYEAKKVSQNIPEQEQNWSRPLRVMSTDSITTGSSWLSSENIAKDTISVGGGSEYNSADYQISSSNIRSPVGGCHSNSSSPGPFLSHGPPPLHRGTDESIEVPTLINNADLSHKHIAHVSHSHEQEERLQMLKKEHHHHLSSLENIPSRSAKDKAIQLHHLKKEARSLHDDETLSELKHHYVKSSSELGGYDSSSLSSSTPDVIPLMFTLPQKPPISQSDRVSSAAVQRPTTATSYTVDTDTYQQSLLRSRSRDEISDLRKQVNSSLDYNTGNRYQLPVMDHDQRRKVPKVGGPHSYSRSRRRPDPSGNEERPGPKNLSSSGYVQRQQTEL